MDREQALLEAVAKAEKAGSGAKLANALDHLAAHYHFNKQFEPAAAAYSRALGIWREILGPKHPSVATLLLNLGQIYGVLERIEEARVLLMQAVGIFETDPTFDDLGALEILEEFTAALRQQGRHHDADALATRIQRISERVEVLVRV